MKIFLLLSGLILGLTACETTQKPTSQREVTITVPEGTVFIKEGSSASFAGTRGYGSSAGFIQPGATSQRTCVSWAADGGQVRCYNLVTRKIL